MRLRKQSDLKGINSVLNYLVSFNERDFEKIEDSISSTDIVKALASYAGKSAASEAKAKGLPMVYATTTKVVLVKANGLRTIIDSAEELPGGKYFKKYTPGTVLYATKQ